MADCPRCGHAEVDGPACPRCGVVVAKYRPPRQRAVAARPSTSSGAWWPFVLLAVVAGAVALIALPNRQGPRAAASPPTPSGSTEVAAVTAADVPPPPAAPPVAVPDPGQVAADLGGIPESDRVKAEELAQRLASRTVNPADADVAEGLLARFPDEASLRNLLEAVLLTLAQKEQQKRDYASAARHLQRAAAVQPGSTKALLGLVAVGMEAGDWAGTESAARAVLALEPRNVEAWRSLGFALLRQDRNREAAEALRTALGIRDDAVTRGLLEKVEKGMLDEGRMKERQLAHFHVRYDGEEHEAVGREILRALERHYATLVSTLDHQPASPIAVILFSRENYYDAAGAPAWSGGNYDGTDGRIRIPIGGLTAGLTPDIDGTLVHELTHAFIADRTKGVAPRVVHEGLAQYMEGKRVDSMLSREQMTWLADGRLGNTVMGFYLGALSFVEYLMALRGQGGMNDLLGAMGETGDVDAAFRRVHDGTFASVQRAWQERLRRQYGS